MIEPEYTHVAERRCVFGGLMFQGDREHMTDKIVQRGVVFGYKLFCIGGYTGLRDFESEKSALSSAYKSV